MGNLIGKITAFVRRIFEKNSYLKKRRRALNTKSKLHLQLIISGAFLILSVANVIARSYAMLAFTLAGCLVNAAAAALAKKTDNGDISAFSSIATCSLLFVVFVICGGNDGFACLWVVLLPFFSMMVMDFIAGLCASILFQFFLIAVFWTPIRDLLLYPYNDQFCLRFPLFFFVTFVLALFFVISLQNSQYNEYKHLQELEEMSERARELARTDPLTGLANRRCAYETFKSDAAHAQHPHCVVMCDIDHFKHLNDSCGHDFGDEVLIALSTYMKERLPADYFKSRWGGEEFLLLADEPLQTVYERIEALRKAVASHAFCHNGNSIQVTVTFGIAEYTDASQLDKAIILADSRMYTGKNTTRNCTVIQ